MALNSLGQDNADKIIKGPAGDGVCRELSLTLDSVLADTPAIPIAGMSNGVVIIPAASSITTLTYYAAEKIGGTYVALHDSAGNAVTQTVSASKAYKLPASVYGCTSVKIVTNTDGAVFMTLAE